MDKIMEICRQALEKAGYEIYGYSDTYQKFTVQSDDGDVVVDFNEYQNFLRGEDTMKNMEHIIFGLLT